MLLPNARPMPASRVVRRENGVVEVGMRESPIQRGTISGLDANWQHVARAYREPERVQ
jgi:hypothetical protein